MSGIGTPRAKASANASKMRGQSRQQMTLEGIREEDDWTTDDWATPPELVADLAIEAGVGAFDLDPCCTPATAKAPRFFTPKEDGLAQPWEGRVWLNPPYSGIAVWLKKAVEEAKRGCVVVALIPAHTDRGWWHDIVQPHATQYAFLRGRVRFIKDGNRANPTFGSAVVIFGTMPPGEPEPPDTFNREGLLRRYASRRLFSRGRTP